MVASADRRLVVVVTGASAGLGRAIVRQCAARRARVVLVARGRARLEEAAREVTEAGGESAAIVGDVADPTVHERAADAAETRFGPIDVWINNAMTSVFSTVAEMRADEYRRVTEVTYLGAVYGTMAALRRMRRRNDGIIIQVGSALAHRSIPLQSAYCAAKHAVLGFTASLRSELLHEESGVRVTVVEMPAMNTPQFDWVRSRMPMRAQPVPPVFQPEVGAAAVMYAIDHDCGRELLVGWPTVKAITGNHIAAGYLDRYLADHGIDAQQTDEPEDRSRPDNLWQPVEADVAAHGRFDGIAKTRSRELWLRTHREWAALAAAGVVGFVIGLARLRLRHG
jgi:short-subunit dehydrogenase